MAHENDKVYLKKDIVTDRIFEKYPIIVFGTIMMVAAILVVASIFWLSFLPFAVLLLIWGVFLAGIICVIIWINEKANLSKSSAFIKRDGVLYYIRLGYTLNGDIPVTAKDAILLGPLDAARLSRAVENVAKEQVIQTVREDPEFYSAMLDELLSQEWPPHLPGYVIGFNKLIDPKLKKQNKDWIWISYTSWMNGKRYTEKFRNAYELDMLDGGTGR